jgi:hypothetical protein
LSPFYRVSAVGTWTYCRFCKRFKPCEPQNNAWLCSQCADDYLSNEWNSSGATERGGELGKDRQVGGQPDALDASDAEW